MKFPQGLNGLCAIALAAAALALMSGGAGAAPSDPKSRNDSQHCRGGACDAQADDVMIRNEKDCSDHGGKVSRNAKGQKVCLRPPTKTRRGTVTLIK